MLLWGKSLEPQDGGFDLGRAQGKLAAGIAGQLQHRFGDLVRVNPLN